KSRSRTTSCRPPWPDARTAGTPASGGESLPSRATMRRRPGRSVTSMRPSGRNASPQGCSSPSATVSTLIEPSFVSTTLSAAREGCDIIVNVALAHRSAAQSKPPTARLDRIAMLLLRNRDLQTALALVATGFDEQARGRTLDHHLGAEGEEPRRTPASLSRNIASGLDESTLFDQPPEILLVQQRA